MSGKEIAEEVKSLENEFMKRSMVFSFLQDFYVGKFNMERLNCIYGGSGNTFYTEILENASIIRDFESNPNDRNYVNAEQAHNFFYNQMQIALGKIN